MKVLWFTNSPSLASSKFSSSSIGRGWIESLESEIYKHQDIELGVVFRWNDINNSSFFIGRTKYFLVKNFWKKNKFKRFVQRWNHEIESDNIVHSYLDIIEDFRPDIIHIFGTEDNFGLIIQKTKVPCIIHIQGILSSYHYKWFSGISLWNVLRYSRKIRLLKGYGILHDYLVNKKELLREKIIFKTCRNFMGRTEWDRRLSSLFSPKSKYYHCDEIIRNEFYTEEWSQKGTSDFTIISVFRNNIYKGLETILQSQKILREYITGGNIIWKIAGLDRHDEIVYLAERVCKESFERNKIVLLGRLGANEMIQEMKNADLFVHPSHIDNSPNSVCEAMLLGMPVITTYAGGIPSLLDNNKEGILVQDGDPYALAGAIVELMNNQQHASLMGKNARERALIRHDKKKIVNDLVEIYKEIMLEKSE